MEPAELSFWLQPAFGYWLKMALKREAEKISVGSLKKGGCRLLRGVTISLDMECCASSIDVATKFTPKWNCAATPRIIQRFPTDSPSKAMKESFWKSNTRVRQEKRCTS